MTRKAQITAAATAFVLAATPTALATPGPSDVHDRTVTVQQRPMDAHDRIDAAAPDTSSGTIGDSHDRVAPALAQPTVVASGGFAWGDAAIGVFGGVGLSLLLGGGLILLVSNGRNRQRVAIR